MSDGDWNIQNEIVEFKIILKYIYIYIYILLLLSDLVTSTWVIVEALLLVETIVF